MEKRVEKQMIGCTSFVSASASSIVIIRIDVTLSDHHCFVAVVEDGSILFHVHHAASGER